MSEKEYPLKGVNVVEMATFIAVPCAGRLLADLGANVIKIESVKGDNLRFTAPSEGRPLDQQENTSFDMENANKKGIVLDLRTDKGKEVLYKLLDKADIFLTNWRPQALARQNLTYVDLKEKYPSLVYGNITGYGEVGPDKDLPGFDFTAFFARGGWSGSLYNKGTVPPNWIPGLGDHQAAMILAAGVLAALYRAKTTGVGDKVSTNLLHSAIFMQQMLIVASQYGTEFGGQKYPMDRRTAALPTQTPFKTKDDRFIQVMTPNYDLYYNKLVTAMDRSDLVDDPVLGNLPAASKAGRVTEIYDIFTEGFASKTAEEWKKLLQDADIPFSVCQTWDEVLADEQAWEIGAFKKMEYPRGTKALVCPPITLEHTKEAPYEKGPRLGEHTEEVLADLGYSDDEIKKMLEENVASGLVEGF